MFSSSASLKRVSSPHVGRETRFVLRKPRPKIPEQTPARRGQANRPRPAVQLRRLVAMCVIPGDKLSHDARTAGKSRISSQLLVHSMNPQHRTPVLTCVA
jgi:hypothetical protein